MFDEILIRYGELSLKGSNKKLFIRKLAENIEKIVGIQPQTLFDRMFLPYNQEIFTKLQYVFGIFSYSPVIKVETDYAKIEQKIIENFDDSKKTFKIVAARNWKNFEMNSDQINRKIATTVFKHFPDMKVDVKKPELEIRIEIRKDFTYIFLGIQRGLGGLPVGISGKALHLISGGIDSPVAAFLMMKRGIEVQYLSFITPPHTDQKTVDKVNRIITTLNQYQGKSILYQMNYIDLMNYIGLVSKQNYKITLMRRSFYRIATQVALKHKILALSNGENLGQVASQTIESMDVIGSASHLQIYRPVVTFDKLEVVSLAERIKTYEISIERANEACEIFAPKNPIIKPNKSEVEKLEAELIQMHELEARLIDTKLIVKKFEL
ncbi:tRNA uracil 4-sulfurtransferase ThiI [Candidatus Mycoplasma pogonae]